MEVIVNNIEKSIFGVCSMMGRKMGISISTVRLYFIYLSFVTFGSPVVIYLFLAFWINIKTYLQNGVHAILD